MSRQPQIYEVEIKSKAILREGKKSFITYFKGGHKKTIVSNVRVLYPQYTQVEDKPVVNITPITYREYEARVSGKMVEQKQHLIQGEGHIMQEEDYGTLGN